MARIYIASSWKNQHAVELLTSKLREQKHEVLSFIENNYGENPNASTNEKSKKFDFEEWMKSPMANKSFDYDTRGASQSDLVIYISPSGKDAAAEIGIAWASGVPILGLYAKGEDFGLMRKLVTRWHNRWPDLMKDIDYTLQNFIKTPTLVDHLKRVVQQRKRISIAARDRLLSGNVNGQLNEFQISLMNETHHVTQATISEDQFNDLHRVILELENKLDSN